MENGRFEAAVSRAYYSMFHAAKALLQTEDSSPKTHEGVNSELGKLFRDRIDLELLREFSRIKQLREDANYEAESSIDKKKKHQKYWKEQGNLFLKLKNLQDSNFSVALYS